MRNGYVGSLGDNVTEKIAAGEISELVVVAEGEDNMVRVVVGNF